MSEERKAAERLVLRLLGLAAAFAVIRWVLPEVWDKLSPFIIAVPIAAALQPVIRFLQKRIKLRRSPASLIPVLLLLFLFLGLIIWLLIFAIEQAPKAINQSGDMVTETINTIRQAFGNLLTHVRETTDPGVATWIEDAMKSLLGKITEWGTGVAGDAAKYVVDTTVGLTTAMPYSIIYISFLTIGLYFIAKNYDDIRSYLPGGKRRKQDSRTTQLTNSTLKSLFGYLKVQGTFALIVWIVSWIYLTCFGFSYAGVTALFCGVMELVPMIGSGVPYIVMSILQFLLGNARAGILLLVLTLGLQLLRRVLEPKLMSDSIGITPLESLIGMFVGMRFGGILGLIGGPVLMSVLVGAFKGGLFASTARDCHLISSWFKNRLK